MQLVIGADQCPVTLMASSAGRVGDPYTCKGEVSRSNFQYLFEERD